MSSTVSARSPGGAEATVVRLHGGSGISRAALNQAWLESLCGSLAASGGILLEVRAGEPAAQIAAWPDGRREGARLRQIAEQVATTRRPAVVRPADVGIAPAHIHVGYPVLVGAEPAYCIAVELPARTDASVAKALEQMQWGAGWLEATAWRRQSEGQAEKFREASLAIELIAAVQSRRSFEEASITLANELAIRLKCARAAIGKVEGGGVRVRALSHTASLRENAALVGLIESAMEEALDQNVTVEFPARGDTPQRIVLSHRELVRATSGGSVVSLVMRVEGKPFAIVMLEWSDPRGGLEADLRSLEAAMTLIGPAFEHKWRERRWLSGRLVSLAHRAMVALFGPRRITVKLAALAVIGAGLALALAQDDFRIAGKVVLEGSVQNAVVAPFEGYIAEAPVRAGDKVALGQTMLALDDRDLSLERFRWESEKDKLEQKLREAQAKFERANAASLAAQVRQATAQLGLAREKLARAKIAAPISGLVVSGDLSQMIGSPVERGKVLFEIAPLDAYRVILQIDETDVQYVHVGMRGQILLAGMAETRLPFTVTKTTTVATAQDGRNFFRVEGQLDPTEAPLKPGMQGVGKVLIGTQPLLWIWLRSSIERGRLLIWSLLP